MTPPAPQIAAHQKGSCPDSRSVVQRKTLDVHHKAHDIFLLLQDAAHYMTLQAFIQINEARIEAPHPYDQVLMLFGV